MSHNCWSSPVVCGDLGEVEVYRANCSPPAVISLDQSMAAFDSPATHNTPQRLLTCSLWLTVTWPSLIPCPVVLLLLLAAGLGVAVRVKRLELQLIFRSYVQSGKCNTGWRAALARTSAVLPVCHMHRCRPVTPRHS